VQPPTGRRKKRKENRKERQNMKIRPLQDRVIVKRLEEEEKTKGGIIIPDTAKEKPQEGKVIAVGKGKVTEDGKVIPLDVKVGDKILFGKYSGSEIKIGGEEHLIMREEDILGIIEGK
jgi:chaperonin GroES